MSHEQMLDVGFLFILGGLDTVTSTLDCAIAHLGRDPALRDQLVADPSRVPGGHRGADAAAHAGDAGAAGGRSSRTRCTA